MKKEEELNGNTERVTLILLYITDLNIFVNILHAIA
jgi:hypothetical protein